MLKVNIVENNIVILPAVRALMTPALLSAGKKTVFNVAGALNCRSRYLDRLRIVEGRLSCLCQSPRIALSSCTGRLAVALVSDDVAGRSRSEGARAVGSGDCQHAARERFLQYCIAGVSRFDV